MSHVSMLVLGWLDRHRQINWALADQAMVSGINFLTGVLIARFLGVEAFGRFTLAWMVVLFVQSIQYALIIQPMLSIGPKQRDDEAETFFGAILSHQLAFAGLCVAVVVAGAFAVDGLFPGLGIDGFALVVAAAVLACQMQDFVRRRLFVRGRPGAAFLNDVVRYVGQIGLLIWLFSRGGLTTIDVLWLLSAVSALAALLGAFSLERPVPTLSVLRGTARRNWSSSSWLTLSAVLHWASSQLFIAAAGALLGASAVGALRAAENLIGGIANIYFLGLENVVPARAAWHLHHNGTAALLHYLANVRLAVVGATIALAFVASAAPELWLTLVFGEAYAAHGDLLRWFALVYVVRSFGVHAVAGLRALETTRPYATGYIAATIFSLGSLYPLIQWLGPTGAVLGIAISMAILAVLLQRGLNRAVRAAS